MEPSQLTPLARELLLLIAPLVNQGAIQKISEGTTEAAQAALARAWAALQRRFQGDADAEDDLRRYGQNPSPGRQQVVAEHIAARFASQEGAAELAALVDGLRSALGTEPRGNSQTFIGSPTIGTNIAGDLHGNLTIGTLDLSRNKRINTPEPLTGTPPVTPPARVRISDPTLSADGQHFSFGHALLIGVAEYTEPSLRVAGGTTANDATALADLLRDPQRAAYPATQVRLLTDTQATRAGILAALDELAQRVASTPNSTVLVFFAGHGRTVQGVYGLQPADIDGRRFAETSITAAMFHERIARIRAGARRLVVILNCCHAGGVGDRVLGEGLSAETSAPPPEFYRPLAAGGGQVVICSSRPQQKSGAQSSADPRHTTFGAHLLAALAGHAPGDDPTVRVFELFAYLRTQVPADARKIWYNAAPLVQEPLFYASQLDDNLALALRPPGATLGSSLGSRTRRLAELELQIELAGDVPPATLTAERDALLLEISQMQ